MVNGDFDRYMLRPMNVFFQIICEKLQPDAVGELLIGTILIIMSLSKGIVIVDGMHIVMFIVSVIAGAVIYTSIKLLFASLSFWIKRSGPFLQVAYEMADFAKYPVEIYSKPIQFILTFVIPFAFVAYFPASYFLIQKSALTTVGIECLIAVILSILAYSIFKIGISKYESAGN